ncbi:MAG: hypothetical protein JJ879_02915 [Sneathiella sp.]|nr:hypothetical protein [Sneathiella sp.]
MSELYRFQIMPEKNVVFVKHYNEINLANVKRRSQAVREHPFSAAGMNRLIDCRYCKIDLSPKELQDIAELISSQRTERGYYTEILLVSGMLSRGFSRMLVAMIDRLDISYEVLWDNDPELEEKVCNLLGLDAEFIFPEFLGLPFRSHTDCTSVALKR